MRCPGAEQGPRAGGEVLQPRADRQHQIGLGASAFAAAVPVTPTRPY
jgi:hypothetical protein